MLASFFACFAIVNVWCLLFFYQNFWIISPFVWCDYLLFTFLVWISNQFNANCWNAKRNHFELNVKNRILKYIQFSRTNYAQMIQILNIIISSHCTKLVAIVKLFYALTILKIEELMRIITMNLISKIVLDFALLIVLTL